MSFLRIAKHSFKLLRPCKKNLAMIKGLLKKRDFYFRALGSLVVLSFPQLVSFFSVFPKPLSETLRRSSDGRIPV
jgi:hypothetical protein